MKINKITRKSKFRQVIDNDIYHIGASLKDLGKKLFAFTKMEMRAEELIKKIK